MTRLINKVNTCLLVGACALALGACAQAKDSTDEISERTTLESRSISIIATSPDGSDTTQESHELVIPTYNPADCAFDIDAASHHISALYEEGNYVIEFDLPYFDYGVSQVGVYTSEQREHSRWSTVNVDEQWKRAVINTRPFVRTSDPVDASRAENVLNSIHSFGVCDIADNADLQAMVEALSEQIGVFPSASVFVYDMSGYDDRADGDLYVNLYSSFVGFHNTLNSENDLTKFTLREELSGLPVGIMYDNNQISLRMAFDNYYGSILIDNDTWVDDFFSSEANVAVDVINYNIVSYSLEGELQPVVPLSDCIQNSIAPMIVQNINHYYVYGAELVYLPLALGYEGVWDISYDLIFVPVWAVYYVSDDMAGETYISANTVLINALTGEPLYSYAR